MNNEQNNQIINDTYQNYRKIEFERIMSQNHGEYLMGKKEFVNKCKTDKTFSERWGLKIEERELSSIERMEYYGKHYMKENESMSIDDLLKVDYEKLNIPTKLITITYKDKTIEVYE